MASAKSLEDYRHNSFHQLWYPRRRWAFGDYKSCLQAAGALTRYLRESCLAPHSRLAGRPSMGTASSVESLVRRDRNEKPLGDESWKRLLSHETLD